MHLGHAQYLPVAPPMFALLAGALAILLILIQVRVLRFAYMQLGVSSGTAFFLLLGSLLGSYVNIPIATLGEEAMVSEREVTYFGMHYIVPELVQPPEVILAVNVGGAIIRRDARNFCPRKELKDRIARTTLPLGDSLQTN